MSQLMLGTPHYLDLELDLRRPASGPIELVVEELPESLQFASDCVSTGSSASTVSSVGCGSFSSAGSFGSYGCVTSSGG